MNVCYYGIVVRRIHILNCISDNPIGIYRCFLGKEDKVDSALALILLFTVVMIGYTAVSVFGYCCRIIGACHHRGINITVTVGIEIACDTTVP